MNDEERSMVVSEVVKSLKVDYVMVHKDQWRMYLARTLAAILLVGGVTFVAVLGVIWSGATSSTTRVIEEYLLDAKTARDNLLAIKKEWKNQEVITVRGLKVVNDQGDEIVTIAKGVHNGGSVIISNPTLDDSEGRGLPHIQLTTDDPQGRVSMALHTPTGETLQAEVGGSTTQKMGHCKLFLSTPPANVELAANGEAATAQIFYVRTGSGADRSYLIGANRNHSYVETANLKRSEE